LFITLALLLTLAFVGFDGVGGFSHFAAAQGGLLSRTLALGIIEAGGTRFTLGLLGGSTRFFALARG
jgi:hypothetical protein